MNKNDKQYLKIKKENKSLKQQINQNNNKNVINNYISLEKIKQKIFDIESMKNKYC